MSGGFDDNPFGDPAAVQDNPFADPSVQRATNATPANPSNPTESSSKTANLDDYQPFDNKKTATSPATVNPVQETSAPPSYTASVQQQQISTADFQRRQEELERRAADLERREQELRNAPYNARANNWPPVPSFCPFQPCFYQDINVDIPVEFQKIVTYLYYIWVAHVSLLFANMMVGLLYLFVGGDYGSTFGLALFYFVIFTPASFVCWFRPAYKAFRDDSSFNFMVFFFVFFFQCLVSILSTLGIMNTGMCGLFLGVKMVSSGLGGGQIFVGVLILITSLAFGIVGLADIFLLMRIHRLYRSTGASMAKAQAEFTTGVMKNETVRQAAAEAAQAQVRSAFNGATGQQQQQQQGGGGRF